MFDPTKDGFGLGFSLTIGEPYYEITEGEHKIPFVRWPVTLEKAGRKVCEVKYGKGVGHFHKAAMSARKGWTEHKVAGRYVRLSPDENFVLLAWQDRPQANFLDKRLWGSLCVKLAKADKSTHPTLAEVLGSLIMDGSADFNAQSFEDWASEYGYDTDSRKAEGIYNECVRIGRALRQSMSADELQAAIEWAQQQ